MLVPLSWLREFTPFEGTAEALGAKLTMLGLELEEVFNPYAGIEDIVVGFIAQCSPHPDSDHMSVCKVDIGQPDLLDIVCGAPNVREGQKVAVAPVGAKLPVGTVIKKAKLRGQPSYGMICSERELGLSDDHSGILVLPESADVGHKLVDALNLDREVLDLSITPNRADCLSILGVARETAAAYGLPFAVPDLPVIPDRYEPDVAPPITITDPDLCRLYAGRAVMGVTIAPAPMRMRYRLREVGIRPINNVVDVTNYVLYECGQPLHAFDLDKLAGPAINVRAAKDGEKFVTLDGKERVLTASDLCVCDARQAVALAGVMGGLDSEISSDTRNIFIESAVFQPQTIRKTSRRLGLVSEASYRFERGVDERRSVWALQRACALMTATCGGFASKGFTINEPRPFIPARVKFSPSVASALLGVQIPEETQKNILESLGCATETGDGSPWTVIQPSWRPDLTREADFIEEVGRMYGLDTIKPVLPPVYPRLDAAGGTDAGYVFRDGVKRWAAGIGLNECVNYSFVGRDDLDFLGLPSEGRVGVLNPLSEEQNVLRSALAPGLLYDLRENLAFDAQSVKLFEIANVFEADQTGETGVRETPFFGLILNGARHEAGWPRTTADFDYCDAKGIAENLFHFLGLKNYAISRIEEHPFLNPCVIAEVAGKKVGFLGRVKPEIAKKYNAFKPVWEMELNLETLRELAEKAKVTFRPLKIYPAIKRDITVIAPKNTRVDAIMEKFLALNLPILEGAALLDVYEPEQGDERRLTFRLTFRHDKRTLKDSEADAAREKAADAVRESMNVKI